MLKIGLSQIKVKPGHPDKNTENILKFMQRASESGADLVVFPEMSIPGYLLGDLWEQPAFLRDCEDCGREIIAASGRTCVLFGNVAVDWTRKNHDGRPRKYNALFAAQNGRLLQPDCSPLPFCIKTLMPNYREFDDSRHFFSLQQLALELGTSVRNLMGPVHFRCNGTSHAAGCMLCEDGWDENHGISPSSILAGKGSEFLVNISSSPFTIGKTEKRRRVFGTHAASLRLPVVYVNCTGIQNNGKTVYTFDGSSSIHAPSGKEILRCKSWEEQLAFADLEQASTMPEVKPANTDEPECIFNALSFGLREFLASTGIQKVVVGISGGIDSAVSAALHAHVLGPENILLLNMPSKFNSRTTRGMARKLATNLGCRYAVIPIQDAVDLTARQLEGTPIEFPAGTPSQFLKLSQLAMENIQARDRSSRILAGAAAAFGGGFTCNANKTEMTVGYSTLYGDQSGFLCALGDLWKHQVYELARHLNENAYGREVIPRSTMDIVPCAELSGSQNVDEGKGDPLFYPYHDHLFRSFVERWNKAAPEDILQWYAEGVLEENIGCAPGVVSKHFPDAAGFIADLEHWWRQFCGMALAKRIQAPPVLAVSRRAFGFDHRESQNDAYFSRRYRNLKEKLLALSDTANA